MGTYKTHGDFYSGPDRYDPGTLQDHKWENARSIDGSWGYRRNINLRDLYTMQGLITKVRYSGQRNFRFFTPPVFEQKKSKILK